MLERFLLEKDSIKKACIDTKADFMLSDDEIALLSTINCIVQKASEAVSTLSSSNANLNTADLAISKCILSLSNKDDPISEKFIKCLNERYIERRIKLADILAFFYQKRLIKVKIYSLFHLERKKLNSSVKEKLLTLLT